METIKVKIINKSHHDLPAYATPGSAGMDVRAFLKEPVVLKPLERALIPTGLYLPDGPVVLGPLERTLIPTGLYMELPHGYECQIRPRSGLAIKHGISLVNTPGTVDSDYRGEIGVILVNLSKEPFTVNDGERVCQMVITRYTRVDWEAAERLDTTKRGEGAFGHTGVE